MTLPTSCKNLWYVKNCIAGGGWLVFECTVYLISFGSVLLGAETDLILGPKDSDKHVLQAVLVAHGNGSQGQILWRGMTAVSRDRRQQTVIRAEMES